MIVLVLLVAAAAFLGIGVGTGSGVLDSVAVGLSLLAVALIVGSWIWPLVSKPRSTSDAVEVSSEEPEFAERVPESPINLDPDVPVVFVAGRTTFHLADCSLVRGKPSSRGVRGDLEAGGMTACKRCLI